MPSSLLRRARVPALISYRGIKTYTADAIAFDPEINPFDVKSDQYGVVDSRFSGRTMKVSGTPQMFTAAALPVYYPWQQYVMGEYNTPRMPVASINTGTSVITTVANHRQITGTGVCLLATGTQPTGTVANTTYFLAVTGVNTLTLYDTEAHAIAGGGTGMIAITGAGSGNLVLVQNSPLTIQYFDGNYLTLLNVATTKMPSLNLSAVRAPFGAWELEGYTSCGLNWGDDNSLFVAGFNSAFADASFDPAMIPTVPYTAKFGNAAPFSDMDSRDGVQLDFNMELKEIPSDSGGTVCRQVNGVTAMAKLLPLNATWMDVLGEINIQGAGAARGASLPTAELDIFSEMNNPYVALYTAMLLNGPGKATSQDDPVGVLNFKTKRGFTAGVAQPVFYVGTTAP